jgi:hypothetical protein
MKATVHFAVPKLPEGRFVAELIRNRDGSYDGVVVKSGGPEKWISPAETEALLKGYGFKVSRRSIERLGYSGEFAVMRPTPSRVQYEEGSVRRYVARVQGDNEYWDKKPKLLVNRADILEIPVKEGAAKIG